MINTLLNHTKYLYLVPKRIIVGGPPNSGKSTFSANIEQVLKNMCIDAKAIDLDLWAGTLDLLWGKISKEERDFLKQDKVTQDDLRKARQVFEDASVEHDVVLGDAPGKISADWKIIYEAASHAIIVCRSDKIEEVDAWVEFCETNGIEVVAIVITEMEGDEKITSLDPLRAKLVGLDRTNVNKVTPTRNKLANLLWTALDP